MPPKEPLMPWLPPGRPENPLLLVVSVFGLVHRADTDFIFPPATDVPVAGEPMELRCFFVVRGVRKPLFVDFTSSMADASGALLLLLIPTWANNALLKSRNNATRVECFFILQLTKLPEFWEWMVSSMVQTEMWESS